MQFVIQVAINGRFSSRHMRQVVNDVTARAVTAFAATGGDPHRSAPTSFFWVMCLLCLILFVYKQLMVDNAAVFVMKNSVLHCVGSSAENCNQASGG